MWYLCVAEYIQLSGKPKIRHSEIRNILELITSDVSFPFATLCRMTVSTMTLGRTCSQGKLHQGFSLILPQMSTTNMTSFRASISNLCHTYLQERAKKMGNTKINPQQQKKEQANLQCAVEAMQPPVTADLAVSPQRGTQNPFGLVWMCWTHWEYDGWDFYVMLRVAFRVLIANRETPTVKQKTKEYVFPDLLIKRR